MGEILDALRKAEQDQERTRTTSPEVSIADRSPTPAPTRSKTTVQVSADSTGSGPLARELVIHPTSPLSEASRKLALKVRAEMGRRAARSIAVTGPLRAEGKTTCACNMALAMASLAGDRRIALIDLDLRRPNIAQSLGIAAPTGIESVIAGRSSLEEACCSTNILSLDLYLSMQVREDSHGLLVSSSFQNIVRSLETKYDIVIFDTPPVLLVPDAVIISELAACWVMVARFGKTRQKNFESAFRLLPSDRCLGTILNDGPRALNQQQYEYYDQDSDQAEE